MFKQWVNQAALPAEEVSPDLLDKRSTEEGRDYNTTIPEKATEHTTSISIDRGIVRLPFRYVLFGISVIVLLLVALSVVCTILIIQS